MANFVQLYKSTDSSAPSLTGQVGSLITLLNKVLVDGYSTASVTSITRSGTTATVTMASANSTLVTGNYVTISGASQSDYNITAQITVVSTTVFTYTVANSPTTPATGTITYAKAGLGWARPFSAGTNAQTYRSADSGSNRFYLQVIDNAATAGGAKEAQAYGAEVMTADQTVSSGQFPTTVQLANGMCWRKSTTADSTARAWSLIGDDRTFYLQMQDTNSNTTSNLVAFGHFISNKAGDGFNTFVTGFTSFNVSQPSSWVASGSLSFSTTSTGFYVARSYTQLGSAQNVCIPVCGGPTALGQSNTLAYPNGSDSGLYVLPVFVGEASTATLRGRMPGLYNPMHAMVTNGWSNYDQATNVAGLSGVTLTGLVGQSGGTVCYPMFDTFGPWA